MISQSDLKMVTDFLNEIIGSSSSESFINDDLLKTILSESRAEPRDPRMFLDDDSCPERDAHKSGEDDRLFYNTEQPRRENGPKTYGWKITTDDDGITVAKPITERDIVDMFNKDLSNKDYAKNRDNECSCKEHSKAAECAKHDDDPYRHINRHTTMKEHMDRIPREETHKECKGVERTIQNDPEQGPSKCPKSEYPLQGSPFRTWVMDEENDQYVIMPFGDAEVLRVEPQIAPDLSCRVIGDRAYVSLRYRFGDGNAFAYDTFSMNAILNLPVASDYSTVCWYDKDGRIELRVDSLRRKPNSYVVEQGK